MALERPSENPSGENVKEREGPVNETLENAGPLSDHKFAVDPRGWMLRPAESTVRTSTRLPEIAIIRARV